MTNRYWGGADDPYVPIDYTLTPDQLAMQTAAPDIADFRTPEEDWAALASQFSPFWQTRAPMADLNARLRARYLIGAPYMTGQEPGSQGYAAFLRGQSGRSAAQTDPATYGGAYPGQAGGQWATSMRDLRRRAAEAAIAAGTPQEALYANLIPETADFDRRAWLASQFRAGDPSQGGISASQARANQRAVATMLALQRPAQAGGGVTGQLGTPYAGQMGNAIRNAIAALYQQRMNEGQDPGSFLDWYLSQTQGTAGTTV